MYSKMKAATPSQEWWFCSDRKVPIYQGANRATNLAQIVARPKTAGDIAAVPTLSTVMSTLTRTNARFQTVLQIGPQSTIVISTLVSNQTVQGKLLLQAGIQKSAVAISHVPHRAALSMSNWTPTILQRSIANTIVDVK
ncbi:hypothetical protein NW768_000826 [Fusarium equiseti]|uniref:Uncharacterized protein n=1 Tax=Fusarium equiseti TaxID=61235 RepID=A0ABQ8RTJ4_FUSEQ|nr:hypothetical protein NW768_000826 [Fusarium equiseti]